MSAPHVIRLRAPWQCEVRSIGAAAGLAGDLCLRQLHFQRFFGQPTGIEPGQRVWLVIENPSVATTVTLNRQPLAACMTAINSVTPILECDVTRLLLNRNELLLDLEFAIPASTLPRAVPVKGELPAQLIGAVRLEIRDAPTKAELRTTLDQVRRNMPAEEVAALSQRVAERFLALPEVAEAQTLMVYASFRNEVQTAELIRRLIALGKTVTVPKTLAAPLLEPHQVTAASVLQAGRFGIPVPLDSQPYTGSLDLCVTPGLGFTPRGDRLGFGKGYYDRFLTDRPQLPAIGLAFERQIVGEIPTHAGDRPMQTIVTENGVIRCTGC